MNPSTGRNVFLSIAGLCVAAVLSVPVLLWSLDYIGNPANRGREIGYYGDFNRVHHALLRMSNVVVLGSYMNADITLEEFGFRLERDGTPDLRLDFAEIDPMRDLRGKRLDEELARRVASLQSDDDKKELYAPDTCRIVGAPDSKP